VRSSGETRMSDFMLWQSCLACLSFHQVLWPDFSLLDLARSVLDFQRSFRSLEAVRSRHKSYMRHQVGTSACACMQYAYVCVSKSSRTGGGIVVICLVSCTRNAECRLLRIACMQSVGLQESARSDGTEGAHVDSICTSESGHQQSERCRTFVDTLWRTRRAHMFRYSNLIMSRVGLPA
jgi:hypothetical protein